MTEDQSHRAIGLLETIGAEVAELRGENRASHLSIDQRFDALDADLECLRVSQQQQGMRLASLPCESHAADIARHARRISEAVRKVASAEQTDRIELAKAAERKNVWHAIGRVTLGVFAVLGALATIGGAVWAVVR